MTIPTVRPIGQAVILAAFALLLLALAPAGARAAEGEAATSAVDWRTHDEALAEAAEIGKPVMIHFTADWCRWCVKMKKETYTDETVAALLREEFVTAMVDADNSPQLKAAYGVQGLPTIWFLTAEGQGITYLPGFVDAATFGPVLRWISTGAYQSQSFEDFQSAEG
jgi:thioredoxin-related protein